MPTITKRNPQDVTLRNVRAAHKLITHLERRLTRLEKRVAALEARALKKR